MRIMTDSAADFTREELTKYQIHCVPMQVIFGEESLPADELSPGVFWQRLLSGEIAKTSQPSPDAFLNAFEASVQDGEEVLYIGVSSAISGTFQSAAIAASMVEDAHIHLVDTHTGAAGQKLLVLQACRLRDEGRLSAKEIADELLRLRSRIHVYAGLDTLENLARSGRISKAAANIGSLAQLKPIVRITPETEGHVEVCGKAIGRHRAIDAVCKILTASHIDKRFPVIPLYSCCADNCAAMIKKLNACGLSADEQPMSSLGPTLGAHIGPNAYGAAFVAAENE